MRAFICHRISSGEELHAKLEWVESDLTAAQKAAVEGAEALKLAEGEKEVIRIKVDKLRKESKIAEVKLKEAKHE